MRRPLALLLAALLLTPACADREGAARDAMAGAAREVQAGRALEGESWDGALARYEAALAAVAKVRKDYADTPAGALAAKPTTYVGPVTLGVLENAILPAVRRRAEAEGSPLACAALLAETVPQPLPRVRALSAVARHAVVIDQVVVAARLVQAAEGTAAGLPAGSESARTAWSDVADALLATRELDRARDVVLTHGLSDGWQRLAIAQVKAGQAHKAAGMISHALGGGALPRAEARCAIATALWKERDPVLVRTLMTEAERAAREVPAAERARASLLMAEHYAQQQSVAQADTWLATSNGLRDATLAELDRLVAAYAAVAAENRLVARVHADLAAIEAGTAGLPMGEEITWLANLAYLQGRLGESDPGIFALSRARLLADGISPVGPGPDGRVAGGDHPDAPIEAAVLLRIAERLFALWQPDPGLGALADASARIAALPAAMREAPLAEGARLAGLAGKPDRVLALVGRMADQARVAEALAAAAAASKGYLTATPQALHVLLARFDAGAPGLLERPVATPTPMAAP